MILSSSFQLGLLASAFLVTTVFGMLLVFAIVVMPGIARLNDGDYIRAFQAIDGVIQDKQPVFYFVWIGSVVVLVVTAGLGAAGELVGERLYGVILATLVYLATQVTTFTINVPMNDRIKELDVTNMDPSKKSMERGRFEASWCFWNWVRTVLMGFVSMYLMYLLLVD